MADPLSELSSHFAYQIQLPAEDVVRLASGLRAAGLRWADIASACSDVNVAIEPGNAGAWATAVMRIFRDVQNMMGATENGTQRGASLRWRCAECRRLVTDIAPLGRPIHTDLGHDVGCPRLARDQAADDKERITRVTAMVTGSERSRGLLQRHRLAGRFIDDCPRCGWHGHFDTWAVTLNGDWARLLCDTCYADLVPEIEVTTAFYICSTQPYDPGPEGPFAVIRRRTRSDQKFPDNGQVLSCEPYWQWTAILAEEARGSALCDVTCVGQQHAEQIIEFLAWRYWPGQAARLPWVASAYPK
jgi:hypothetical protein